ncbi:hypothetical protein CEXT_352941 [Caerostris extrusa]|uniref:Uncharacterized protein n=1 Tax=Caerostris extrusa TaxID=172846 RepID=A0AAV4SLU6_CAEEX|nr:hypothetical protein CEXT_352941 [Caerostris extrusa]
MKEKKSHSICCISPDTLERQRLGETLPSAGLSYLNLGLVYFWPRLYFTTLIGFSINPFVQAHTQESPRMDSSHSNLCSLLSSSRTCDVQFFSCIYTVFSSWMPFSYCLVWTLHGLNDDFDCPLGLQIPDVPWTIRAS